MTDVTLFSVERAAFQRLCQDSPELLAIALTSEIRRQNSSASAKKELLLTRQEIAWLVGASQESVSCNLITLEQEGIVRLGCGRVTIEDWERLNAIAGGTACVQRH